MCLRFELNDKAYFFFYFLIVCLFVCVVDRGVNEGEPVDEQYCEQENEDQFCDPSPKDSTSIRNPRKDLKTTSSIPSFDACFCPSFFYKHNLLAYFIKLYMFCLLKTWLDSHPLICYNHSLTTQINV